VAARTPPWFRVETCWGNAAGLHRAQVLKKELVALVFQMFQIQNILK
jgi:hypothetical protein